jgi:hypothetical protein
VRLYELCSPAMAGLRFKLLTGDEVFKTIESADQASAELEAFRRRDGAYADSYFEIDDDVWVSRDAVISIAPFAEESFIR